MVPITLNPLSSNDEFCPLSKQHVFQATEQKPVQSEKALSSCLFVFSCLSNIFSDIQITIQIHQ